MPAASWFLRMAEPDPVMSKRCCAPGTNLSRTMRREPSGRTVPGHDPPPPGLRRGTIPAFYRKMQELQRWHADSQNTPSWLCFLIYTIILLRCSKRSLFRRMKNFLTSFAWHGGSGGGGCVFAGRPSRFCRKESFLSYQELITKRKVGRGAPHFAADGAASAAGRPSPGEGDARRDNSPGSGAISSSKSLLHICQQNYKKAKGEGNPSPFLCSVYAVSFSRSASTAASLPRLIS